MMPIYLVYDYHIVTDIFDISLIIWLNNNIIMLEYNILYGIALN